MTWADDAERVLAAAVSSGVTDDSWRTLIAGGPSYAKDCRMIGVHLDRLDTQPVDDQLPIGFCPTVSVRRFVVTVVHDCYPVGTKEAPAPAADITAASLAFLTDLELVWNALVDASVGAVVMDQAGSIGGIEAAGPMGGTIIGRIAVAIALDPPPPEEP